MAKKYTPSIDLLIPSAVLIKDSLPTFFVLLVVPMLLSGITNPMPALPEGAGLNELTDAMRSTVTPFAVAGFFLTLILYPLLTYAQWQAAQTKSVTLSQAIIGGQKHYLKLIGLLMVMTLIISLGLAALILPGIILIRMLILSPFYMLQYDLGIVDSLKRSARESKEYRWSIYGIMGIIAMFALISGFGIVGQICGTILSALYSLAFALRFHEVKSSKNKPKP